MFCTVVPGETKKRLGKNVKVEEKKVGNISFYKVTCYKSVNCRKIEKRLKGKVDTVILSDKIGNAVFDNLTVYKNDDFLKTIAYYTFKNIIKLCNLPPNELVITIIDSSGEHSDFVFSLAKYAATIKIVTDNFEKYYEISDKMYENFGMFPIISDELSNFTICFDFDRSNPRICFNNEDNFCELTKECVKIGAGLSSFVPKGISECDFAGVLNQYNDFKRLRLLSAEILIKDEKMYKVNKENIQNFLDIRSEN